MNSHFSVPARADVSESNQQIFDILKKQLGMVPNLYALLGTHPNALSDYLKLSERPSSLTAKEKEVVNLIVSEVNGCLYCLSAHTMVAKLKGFSEDQTIELRSGKVSSDQKLNVLAKVTLEIAHGRGKVGQQTLDEFFAAGYSVQNLIDVVFLIGERVITNYLGILSQVEVDFPLAKLL